MDFRHLIVTCLFSMLRLPFDNQKVKGNYAIFLYNRRDFPSKCLPFRLLKWRIKSVKHRFRRVNPKLWLMKWRKKTTKKEKRRLSFYANLKLNLN